MTDMKRASEIASLLAEKMSLDTGRSCVVVIGDGEGGVVGACIAELELAAMVAQLRLVADSLEEQAAATMN
jgi:hypothetical protein